MVPHVGASGLAIRVYSMPWPPPCPGDLPTWCTIEGAPLLDFAAIQDALGAKAIRAPGRAEFCIGLALKKRWCHGTGL